MAHKRFQDLNLKDAFLFSAALSDEEICRLILEMILEQPLSRVKVHAEHALLFRSEFRSVRLDIYADDEMQVGYNLEMQNENEYDLPKRSRFHQAEMDVTSLKPGQDFSDLKPGYVIFICTFDPFGEGLYRYTFEERCLEKNFPLGDETRKIFLNTKGRNRQDVPEELVCFLQYVEHTTDVCADGLKNEHLKLLHERISRLKKSREWEARYMTLEDYLRQRTKEEVEEVIAEISEKIRRESSEQGLAKGLKEGREEGREEGIREGQLRMLKLITCMVEHGESEQIPQLEKDQNFLETMYLKYNL